MFGIREVGVSRPRSRIGGQEWKGIEREAGAGPAKAAAKDAREAGAAQS